VVTVLHAELREPTNDVVFWTLTGAHVYNYVLDKWTTWGALWVGADHVLARGDYLLAFATISNALTLHEVEWDTASDEVNASWETAWIQPAGPSGKAHIREVVLLCRRDGAHGIEATVYTDYQTDAAHTTAIVMLPVDVTNALQGSYYTLRFLLKQAEARAVKLLLQETNAAGEGCVPLACTMVMNVDPGVQRRYLAAGNK
jgi:hypothetical protein